MKTYKVFRVMRVSSRRSILARHLTLEQAQRMVRSFPDSSRSMVCFTAEN